MDSLSRLGLLSAAERTVWRAQRSMSGTLLTDGGLARAIHRPIESQLFGCRIAGLEVLDVRDPRRLLQEARAILRTDFDLVVSLVPADRSDLLRVWQDLGARVAAANLQWVARTRRIPLGVTRDAIVDRARMASPNDAAALLTATRASFTSYQSHWHAEPRLPAAAIIESYAQRVRLHTEDGGETAVIGEARVEGFSTVNPAHELNTILGQPRLAEVSMSGVVPDASAPGAYVLTLRRALRVVKSAGFEYVVLSCKADNFAVQSTWASLGGFSPRTFRYRLHWWL